MRQTVGRLARWSTWVLLLAGGVALVTQPAWAPLIVSPALLAAFVPTTRAWKAASGTALRPATLWALLSIGLGLCAELFAATEPLTGGRPWAGHLTYLCVLTSLAGLLSVLNARTPGGGAWAILMSLLVLVFLIPWLESAGLGRAGHGLGRLRLDNPWTIFYWLLVVAGVTNYLPTRYGPASAFLGLGFLLEYVGLTRTGLNPATRATLWAVVPWTLATAVAAADLRASASPAARSQTEAVWFWFRDHWGVVWALRLLERFNRSAESLGWPTRLTWHGLVALEVQNGRAPEAAEATLKSLLRRFATDERIAEAVGRAEIRPCGQQSAR